MSPSLHPLPMPEQFTAQIAAVGRRPCSSPVLIDITAMDAADPAVLQPAWLSMEEGHRLEQLTFSKRRRHWLAGRICAKIAIEDYLRCHAPDGTVFSPTELSIANAESGRPFITAEGGHRILAEPEISISHSGDFAMALAASSSCGVDIQQIVETLLRVKERFCTDREEDLLRAATGDDDRSRSLALLWTAKEAAQKALSIAGMPGLLDLLLVHVEKTGDCERLLIFSRYHRQARLASEIRVSATCLHGCAIAVCIP